jgi:hypothetical protein
MDCLMNRVSGNGTGIDTPSDAPRQSGEEVRDKPLKR